ncbi:MAG: hypothetical protein Q9161_006315 [Pseudevernia consocians]
MAQEFLSQLLRIENTVQVDELEARTCMICLESYGTLNSSTGAVELQVRLPCDHLVGTFCIATWLRDNNNCPACRKTFFPAQPRPYLEHEIINDRPSENTRTMDFRDGNDPVEFCDWLCSELVLNGDILEVAQSMCEPLWGRFNDHSPECNAAICVYIAWHLLTPDSSVATFLADLSHTVLLGEDLIRSTYRLIYPDRMRLIVPEILPRLARFNMEGIHAFLPTPSLDNPIINREEDNDREGRTSDGTEHDTVDSAENDERGLGDEDEFREQLIEVLGDEYLFGIIEDMTAEILVVMDTSSQLAGRSAQLRIAVCAFMACHLRGVEISYSEVARIYGVGERTLREGYADAFDRRSVLVLYQLAETIGNGNLERVLGALPALNWPPP